MHFTKSVFLIIIEDAYFDSSFHSSLEDTEELIHSEYFPSHIISSA